jgi:hypothetical protein
MSWTRKRNSWRVEVSLSAALLGISIGLPGVVQHYWRVLVSDVGTEKINGVWHGLNRILLLPAVSNKTAERDTNGYVA